MSKSVPEVTITEKTFGKYKFVLSGKKVLIFVGDALCDASTEYPTLEEAQQVWQQVLRAEGVK